MQKYPMQYFKSSKFFLLFFLNATLSELRFLWRMFYQFDHTIFNKLCQTINKLADNNMILRDILV